ncbi:MAG: Bax inhibitor-1 family protein [Saprospiraceae bacterium]|nr:Bax inhibitor-1 family protein [Pyrinomonadaceae bacterium]
MEQYTSTFGNSAADALPAERASFIRKTYLLLAAAILAFIVVEGFLFASGTADMIASVIFSGGAIGWLLVLGLFMGVSFLANRWATSETSKVTQYLGLGFFIVAEAVIFVPLIWMATYYSGDTDVLAKAGIVTIGLFLGITATVFITRTDFSFLGPILAIGGFAALGFIVASALFGFSLGNVFAFIMVAFAGTAILYETSNVLHRFNTSQHVAASLTLFASIALLFWYILSIFSSRD